MATRRKSKPKQTDEAAAAFKPFWSGTISFGLVSVPVYLFPANRRGGVPMRLLDSDGTPVNRRYFCPEHDRDVSFEHIVRGYELENGHYVVVSDEELESLEPKKSQEIDLQRVVDVDQISPLLFERTYYLTPSGTSTKAYRLLADVLERTKRAGIATFVMRDKEYLVAILAKDGILRAETMRFPDEVRTPELIGLPEAPALKKRQVSAFEKAIKTHSAEHLSLEELKDEQSEQLRRLIERKHKAGKDVVEVVEVDDETDDEAPEADLLETIRRSLHSTRDAGSRHTSNGRHTARETQRTNPRRRSTKTKTKAELYDRAAKLDIEGRSHMNREQLERAVRARSS